MNSGRQPLDGPPHQKPHQTARDGDHERGREGHLRPHAPLVRGQRLVDRFERKHHVQHAQDALRRRVCVAGRVRAFRLVLDGPHQAHQVLGTGIVGAPRVARLGLLERLVGAVADEAGVGALVHHRSGFPGQRRELHLPLLREDADLPHARLGGNGADDLHQLLAVVAQHAGARRLEDDAGHPLLGHHGRRLQVLAQNGQVGPAQAHQHRKQAGHQSENQLRAKTPHTPVAAAPRGSRGWRRGTPAGTAPPAGTGSSPPPRCSL